MSARIVIDFAKSADEPEIIAFLREHWRADHIFVTHPEVLRWQHESPGAPGQALTFVFARRTAEDGKSDIAALQGFIPFRRFDRGADCSELALAIWKAREDIGVPGLGVQLLKTIQRSLKPAMICAVGLSETVLPIYEALGYSLAELSHSALFPQTEHTGGGIAAGVPEAARRFLPADPNVQIKPVIGESLPEGLSPALVDNLAKANLPRKSWNYVLERYARHPWYRYSIRAVIADGKPAAILVWRKVSVTEGSILRIVDVIGQAEVLARCGAGLRDVLMEAGCQYIDIMHLGISEDALRAGGFVGTKDFASLVLPNYFAPYERRNIRIDVAYKVAQDAPKLPLRLFRADSDQDRPNRPEEVDHASGAALWEEVRR